MTQPYTPDPAARTAALDRLRAEIVNRVYTLAKLREYESRKAKELAVEREAFEARTLEQREQLERAKHFTGTAERELRALALDYWNADPSEKQITTGVSIAIRKGVEYDADRALAWAKEKGMFLVPESLNAKALDKFLLTNESEISLKYSRTDAPTVTLATDLSAFLSPEPTAQETTV